MRKPVAFLALTLVTTACHKPIYTPSGPTPPKAPPAVSPQIPAQGASFRNLTHPDVSPFWGRVKSDEENASTSLLAKFGLNWVPVVTVPDSQLTVDSRVDKRTACGKLRIANLFIGKQPTAEMDWNLLIVPTDTQLVSLEVLSRSAKRVKHVRANLSRFFDQSGKYLEPKFWHHDAEGRTEIEAEVTPPRALLESPSNPLRCAHCDLRTDGRAAAQTIPLASPPQEICTYGAWVQESIHGFRPEIHPAEAIFWRGADGVWNLLMLQDASYRFDASDPRRWKTVFGPAGSPSNTVPGEHWVQEAMVGEFVVPVDATFPSSPRVEVVGQQGLEAIGSGGYPSSTLAPGAVPVAVSDQRVQASLVQHGTSQRFLVVRAQIRGAPTTRPLRNDGAYLHLRIPAR
ncbi:MAG: hypothetical protein AVDCRST_MAG68-4698 [uncultured Gemmatimonadetes bacterium]|uniref:Uncharacterized protein n=1 Tax=uncultured Gemmatimonadota bacterium TaxID=203437 RepID=A0A6J4MPX0_9BACT|nr:MAG: hypothetical protein AVDCRST_MAG68-4698 [uncultured Gemmatimonadota bacterium]